MKKGIVMEIDGQFLTLLTPEGQFLQAKKQKNCVLGEEIFFTPMKKQLSVKRFIGVKQLSAAAVILLILFGALLPLYQNDKAYAYVSIDGKPSIELGVNKEMQVVTLTPYNNAGKIIISHLGTWRKVNVTSVTQAILNEMKKQGYLKKSNPVVISTVQIELPAVNIEKQFTKNIAEIKEMVIENNLNPVIFSGTEQDMEKAHHLGITTGKYKEETSHPANKMKQPLPVATKPVQEKVSKEHSQMGRNNNYKQNDVVENHRMSENKSIVHTENTQPANVQKKVEEPTKRELPATKATGNDEKKNGNNDHMKQQDSMENAHHDM